MGLFLGALWNTTAVLSNVSVMAFYYSFNKPHPLLDWIAHLNLYLSNFYFSFLISDKAF